jgi:hypothetical protein
MRVTTERTPNSPPAGGELKTQYLKGKLKKTPKFPKGDFKTQYLNKLINQLTH